MRDQSSLELSQKEFSLFINRITEIVLVLNTNREVVFYNDALYRISDNLPANVIGMRPGEIFSCIHLYEKHVRCGTTDFCKNCGAYQSLVSALEGEPNVKECMITAGTPVDNTVFNFEVNSSMFNKEGEDLILFILRDIREAKKGRLLEKTFFDLIQNLQSGVAIYEEIDHGEDFIFQYMNHAAEAMEGIKKEDILGKKVTSVFPGVKEIGLLEVLQKVYRTGEAISHPLKFYRDHRIAGWRDNYIFKLPTGEVVALYNDVTSQKQEEEILADHRNWLNLIFDTVNTGIMIVEGENLIINDVNKTARSMIGLDETELIGERYSTVLYLGTDLVQMALDKNSRTYQEAFLIKEDKKTPIMLAVTKGNHHKKDYYILSFFDITERIKLEKKLKELLVVDELTRIRNRRALRFDLAQAVEYANVNSQYLEVLMLDIDYFKNYNDLYGHQQGDECLRRVASIIQKQVEKEHNNVYRYGGEEFAVILMNTKPEIAIQIGNDIRLAVEAAKIPHEDSAILEYVTVSVGVGIKDQECEETSDDIIKKADKMLYLAKFSGRNQVK